MMVVEGVRLELPSGSSVGAVVEKEGAKKFVELEL
jgi:hypothetical protein